MGNYRFKFSDMIPNAWFYKLRDMSKTKTKTTTTTTTNHHKKPQSSASYYSSSTTTTKPPQSHHFSHPRNSFYYTPRVSQFHNSPKFPHFHDPPRKSSKKSTPNRKTIYKPSPKHNSQLTESTHILQDFFHSPVTSESPSSESTQSGLTSCTCRVSSSTSDIIIDVNEKKIDNFHGFDFLPETELKLPPIITKPAKPISRNRQSNQLSGKKVNESQNPAKPISRNREINQLSGEKVKESQNPAKPISRSRESNKLSGKKVKESQTPARKSLSGVKVKGNSPKLAVSKRIGQKKKNLSESFAIVKSSFDPQKDFMDSMMEMILENNIRETKDLEELLACYLSLNSDEYHDAIVKAFEQIWFTLPEL